MHNMQACNHVRVQIAAPTSPLHRAADHVGGIDVDVPVAGPRVVEL